MNHPKNVQAVIDWYKKSLLLHGFEAGRRIIFEREHPEVVSGLGYHVPLSQLEETKRMFTVRMEMQIEAESEETLQRLIDNETPSYVMEYATDINVEILTDDRER